MAKIGKEFLTSRFVELYNQKWRSQQKSQRQFAERIRELDPTCGINETYVSKLLKGDYAPKKYLPIICKALDVDITEFIPKKHDDKYQYYSEFADGLENKLEEVAKKNFGLDLTFIRGIRNIVPNFDQTFPVCTPLVFRDSDSEGRYFKRASSAESSKTSEGQGLLQISRDGQTLFLTIYDLKILKSVQNKVKHYVSGIFEETAKRLDTIEEEANREYIEVNTDIWEQVLLTDEQLQEIDPYGFYTEAERKRYHLPEGKIFEEQEENHNGNG